jgi:ABC-type Fe3+-hydroxamate transport system substrate-binding protein
MRTTVRDNAGREVTFAFPPERIVCLCPSLTETLCALGCVGRLVGRTRYCVRPADQVGHVELVGGTRDFDVGRIRALQPDLVIADQEENPRSAVESLAALCPVFVCYVTDCESAVRVIANLGELVDRAEQAATLVRDVRRALARLRPGRRQRVAYLIWRDPYMAAGGDTYIHALLEKCGLDNVCGDLPGRYPEVSIELLRQLDPAWILLSSEPFPFDESHVAEFGGQLPRARVISVDGQMFGWYGSRMLAAADYLERLITDIEADASPPEA